MFRKVTKIYERKSSLQTVAAIKRMAKEMAPAIIILPMFLIMYFFFIIMMMINEKM